MKIYKKDNKKVLPERIPGGEMGCQYTFIYPSEPSQWIQAGSLLVTEYQRRLEPGLCLSLRSLGGNSWPGSTPSPVWHNIFTPQALGWKWGQDCLVCFVVYFRKLFYCDNIIYCYSKEKENCFELKMNTKSRQRLSISIFLGK